MGTRVVGVHGIGNHQAGMTASETTDMLSRRWSNAIQRGLGRQIQVDLRVAYYAHHLAKDTAQGIVAPEHLDESEQEMLLSWARELGAPTEVAQGRLLTPARHAADWIARRFGLDHRLVRLMVATFCREVHTYLSDEDRRRSAQAEVATVVTDWHAEIVIAHSLGSVVTFETLWANPDIQIELLLTLGSPLAMPDVIFPKLQPKPNGAKCRRPPGVRRWINIADPGDFIAIPKGLGTHFEGVSADLTTPIATFDMHKVTNYLSCTTTAAALTGIGSW